MYPPCRALRQTAADVVVLNEVDAGWSSSQGVDQTLEIATALNMPFYAFGPCISSPAYGNAVLSRFAITGTDLVPLPGTVKSEPRCALRVDIMAGGRKLTVIGTHLGLQTDERMQQVRPLVSSAGQKTNGSVLLAGDFNATLDALEMRYMASRFYDTDSTTQGSGTEKVDYIFVSPLLVPDVLEHDVIRAGGSDHLPVATTLKW